MGLYEYASDENLLSSDLKEKKGRRCTHDARERLASWPIDEVLLETTKTSEKIMDFLELCR